LGDVGDRWGHAEALHGHAVRLGERQGIPTPMLFAVYAALKPYAGGPPRAVTA